MNDYIFGPCDHYTGNLCSGFGGDTECVRCGWDRFEHPYEKRTLKMIGPTLTERRAIFIYEGARIAAIAAKAPIIPAPWEEREGSFKNQFLKLIDRQMGVSRSGSPEELHGSWVQAYVDLGWEYGEVYDPTAKTHPDMVPYASLGQLERDKDAVFVALCEIARQWIYDLPG